MEAKKAELFKVLGVDTRIRIIELFHLFQKRRDPCYPKNNEKYLPIFTSPSKLKGCLMKKRHT